MGRLKCTIPDCERRINKNNRFGLCDAHRRETPEALAQKQKTTLAWQKNNPSKANAAWRRYYAKSADRIRAQTKVWRLRNRDRLKLYDRRRRERELAAGGRCTEAEWLAVLERYGHTCPGCGRSDCRLERDHVVPVVCGGPGSVDNLQPLCPRCNARKGRNVIHYLPWSRQAACR